jgi:hypothetical protein
MMIPTSLLLSFSIIGIFAIAILLTWLLPQVWYRIKNKRFKPSYEGIELAHAKQVQELELEHMRQMLMSEQKKNESLTTELKQTFDKLVSNLT